MTKFGITKNPSDVLEAIAQKHKILRKQQGLSQQELAKRSGVSFGSIKRFETSGQISFESLLKLALILNRMNDFDLIFTSQDDLEKVEKLFSDKTRA
ncbi:MAG: helix-turn-helix transcriptional regulator [Bacteroidetes bacterium]|nr:helix-turn-helix transcriptional regulator [Bacteroidota bacterium]